MKIFKDLEQRSPEWLELKKGKIGGTRLKAVLSSNNLPLIYELLAEQGSEELEENYVSPAMQWGIDMEEVALHLYREEFIFDSPIEQFGWLQADFSELVGISPDGLTADLKHAVEIKCPSTKKHVEYIITNRIPAEYKAQVLHYFIVNDELESLDFVSFDPRYSKKPLHVIVVERAEIWDEIVDAKARLIKFLEKLEAYRLKLKL